MLDVNDIVIDNAPEFQSLLTKHRHPFFPGNTTLTKFFKVLFIKKGWKHLIGIIFRYPTLMILSSVIIFNSNKCYLRHSFFWLIIIALSLEAIHLIVYRLQFGSIDNYLNFYSTRYTVDRFKLPLPKYVSIQRFFKIYSVTFVIIVIAFASLYDTIIHNCINANSFQGIVPQEPTWIQSIYFSTLTICTVGYGDIYPVGIISKILVTAQMFLGFILLVLLLTTFTATIESKD